MIDFIERFPWTKGTVATFLVLSLATGLGVAIGREVPDGWFSFVLTGLGAGLGGLVGKRATTKASVIREENGHGLGEDKAL